MSLILNESLASSPNLREHCSIDDQNDLDRLDRYLAVIENNKKSCRFVPNDVMLALDMAGFVAGELYGKNHRPPLSAARLALSLVQPCAPVQ